MMDVTFVLEESGVTATVEVPCEAKVAAAKEVACTALAVSPASVEMRIGTQVLEGTCRLQDTAFDSGVQVVLACPRFADIKCPAEYDTQSTVQSFSLSPCGTLCLIVTDSGARIAGVGFDTETFNTAFSFEPGCLAAPAIQRCKTRCYLACGRDLRMVALPGGEVLRKVTGSSTAVFACGGVVVSQGRDGVSVYDEGLTLLRSISHKRCSKVAASDCGGRVISYSWEEKKACLWDVNTGEAVACVESMPPQAWEVRLALSRSASVFAVGSSQEVQLYDWSGAALGSIKKEHYLVEDVQFTPCGKYVVVHFMEESRPEGEPSLLYQYDMSTMSCVRVMPECCGDGSFAISPCSRVVMFETAESAVLVTRHLYPY